MSHLLRTKREVGVGVGMEDLDSAAKLDVFTSVLLNLCFVEFVFKFHSLLEDLFVGVGVAALVVLEETFVVEVRTDLEHYLVEVGIERELVDEVWFLALRIETCIEVNTPAAEVQVLPGADEDDLLAVLQESLL
jgi:hypothetical protein